MMVSATRCVTPELASCHEHLTPSCFMKVVAERLKIDMDIEGYMPVPKIAAVRATRVSGRDGFAFVQITAALDTFESDNEAEAVADLTAGAEPAMMEVDTPEAAAEAGSLSAPATRHSRDNSSRARGVGKVVGMTRAKRGPGRPAGGRAKRVKVEAAAKDPPAPVADELLLDTEYVMGARSRQGQGGASSSVVAAEGGWEAGAAGKIRLMARLQAFQSLQSAQSGSASQSRGAGTEGCASFDRVQCTAGRASSLAAVDELLRVFEAVHKKLELHVDHAG